MIRYDRFVLSPQDYNVEYPEIEVKAVGNAPAHFHTATNDYQDKLKALMTSFFAKGQPSSESELNTRLVQLIQGYMALSSAGIDNAFQTGFDHVAQGHKPSSKGLKAVSAIKRNGNKYFDGLIGDLKDAVMAEMKKGNKQVGIKGFGDLTAGFINRIGMYASNFWQSLWEGVGDVLRQDNTEVERQLDEGAEHCATCPDKARVYKSYDAMVAEVGVPGDGSDDCGPNCKCTLIGALPE